MTHLVAKIGIRLGSAELPSRREIAEFALCYLAAVTLAFGITLLVGVQAGS